MRRTCCGSHPAQWHLQRCCQRGTGSSCAGDGAAQQEQPCCLQAAAAHPQHRRRQLPKCRAEASGMVLVGAVAAAGAAGRGWRAEACLPACLLCLVSCPTCLVACKATAMIRWQLTGWRACVRACLLACVLAAVRVSVHACLFAWLLCCPLAHSSGWPPAGCRSEKSVLCSPPTRFAASCSAAVLHWLPAHADWVCFTGWYGHANSPLLVHPMPSH